MKKRVFPLALVLALCLSLCAQAVTPRINNDFTYTPDLDVSGNTATCMVTVMGKESTAKITANISLQVKSGSGSYTTLCGWSTSGPSTSRTRMPAFPRATAGCSTPSPSPDPRERIRSAGMCTGKRCIRQNDDEKSFTSKKKRGILCIREW